MRRRVAAGVFPGYRLFPRDHLRSSATAQPKPIQRPADSGHGTPAAPALFRSRCSSGLWSARSRTDDEQLLGRPRDELATPREQIDDA